MDTFRDFIQNHINKALCLPQVQLISNITRRPSNEAPSLPTEGAHEIISKPESFQGLPENPTDQTSGAPDALADSEKAHETAEPPRFTKGSARFILANDGSEDCMALLVNDTLIQQLRDLFQYNRDLDIKQGPLEYAQRNACDIESSIKDAQESLTTAESQEKADRFQAIVEQRESELIRACKSRDKKEKQYRLVERKVASARDYTQYALETAMEEANLLGPGLPTQDARDSNDESHDQSDYESSDEFSKKSEDFSRRGSDASGNHNVGATESEILCRAACEDLSQKCDLLQRFQDAFDSQGAQYGVDLAKYQQGFENGTFNFSRTEFDRRKVDSGRKLTRALIDAEADFEEAKGHALALGAIASSYGGSFEEGTYEESFPENQIASYLANKDWGFVHKWQQNLLSPDMMDDPNWESNAELVEVDEWDAGEVNIEDSLSAIDFDEHGKDIDYWREECGRLREELTGIEQ